MPSGAELDVHIGRLTDSKAKKIWYEWHAESFLPITGTVNGMMSTGLGSTHGTPSNGGMHGSRVVSGASSNMSVPMHSPMMDAPGSPMPGSVFGMSIHGRDESRIKIGQTRLHNTTGRSSWVGL
jgi:protein arginine N-methyltransferase 5